VKVKELIKQLQGLDGDLPVILASDEEGNNFHHLDGAELSAYSEFGGEVDVIHPSVAEGDEPLAVVLWP
jgi:hypothetical protein